MTTLTVVLNACETCLRALKEERNSFNGKLILLFLMCNCHFRALVVVYCSCSNASEYIAVAICRENEVKEWCKSFSPNFLLIRRALVLYIAPTKHFLTLRDLYVYRLISPSNWKAQLNFTNIYSHSLSYIPSCILVLFHSARRWRLQYRRKTGTTSTHDTAELWKSELYIGLCSKTNWCGKYVNLRRMK
jgi:hypothetical protein